jgi:serum/glucocorticoid-regulated kinase 2
MGHSGVGLEDFIFLQMLGIGGFSKVYLVKKRDTNELYALKSVRLPDKR